MNIPLITKFYSNATIYDQLGNSNSSYKSLIYDSNYIYFLMDTVGTVIRYNTTTEEYVTLKTL